MTSECNKGRAYIPTDSIHPLDLRRVKKFCSLNSFAQCPNNHREYLLIRVQRVLLEPNTPRVKYCTCTCRPVVFKYQPNRLLLNVRIAQNF